MDRADRIRIEELWVPAAMLLEKTTSDKQSDEFAIWRQEARYRFFDANEGIRVFSVPNELETMLSERGLSLSDREHLIVHAGEVVDGFSLSDDGVEFFCHSPFSDEYSESATDLRNAASLVFNIRFQVNSEIYNYFMCGDTNWNILAEIVRISEYSGNDDRLAWDIYNIPHHCSYLALSDEKGEETTEPCGEIQSLLNHGTRGAYMISSSNPIEETAEAYEQTQPPHIQAFNCYKEYLKSIEGCKIVVTMEDAKENSLSPLVFTIGSDGITYEEDGGFEKSASFSITSRETPRAGFPNE